MKNSKKYYTPSKPREISKKNLRINSQSSKQGANSSLETEETIQKILSTKKKSPSSRKSSAEKISTKKKFFLDRKSHS